MHLRLTRRTAAALSAVALTLAGADAATAHTERPDLVVTRVANPPSVVGTGGTMSVNETVTNTGSAFAGRSTTRYFIARSGAGPAGEEQGLLLRGGRAIQALGPRRSARGGREVVVPDVPAGTYDFVACADARNRVREISEGNNCRSASRSFRIRADKLPSVFIGGGSMPGIPAFTEDGAAVRVVPDLMLVDEDDTRLSAATVSILGGAAGTGARLTGTGARLTGDGGRDWFFFAEQLGITGTYDTGTGVLTLTGRATVADYQTALRSIWYRWLGDDPPSSRRLQIRVRDAVGGWSGPATQRVDVTPVNDPPVLAFASALDHARLLVPGIVVLDMDSEIARATVSIAQGWGASDIDLEGVQMLGITGTYNSGTGVLTLTGTASVPDYQAALRSVELTRKPAGKGPGTFELQVVDAGGAASNILPYVEQQP